MGRFAANLFRVPGGRTASGAEEGSITDWLFLLYSFGVGVMLLRYLLAYLRLRCCLRLGHPAPLEVQRTVYEIGKRYTLRVCLGFLPLWSLACCAL